MQARIIISFVTLLSLPLMATASPVSRPSQAAVASANSEATQAGMQILAEGGNAFDAAVAVSAALAVVEPYSSGIGGGGFWLLHVAKGDRNTMIDGREYAPAAATADMYQDKNGDVIKGLSLNGPLSAGIPGEPAALVYLN
ncbi:MAG: gamma-glutamyltransferase, partial [Gammaproteobacteria bacterium]